MGFWRCVLASNLLLARLALEVMEEVDMMVMVDRRK